MPPGDGSSDKPTSFAVLLREHRLRTGFSQEYLAERARVSTTAIGLLERGARRAPYRSTVQLLAKALGLAEHEQIELEAAAARARARSGGQPSDVRAVFHNVPEPLTSFIGREAELADLRTMLIKNRLVTVTGSGGTGKTRLALEIARQRARTGEGEVWFVDLTPISDDGFVAARIAIVTGAILPDDEDPDILGAALKTRRMLLILDNCEHVVSGAAAAALAILQRCPHIAILATSRERLAVSGEAILRLGPLPLPERPPTSLDQARSFAAVELFIRRAVLIEQDHHFTLERIAAVSDICHRLDGLPLAIELAVARLPQLGLDDLRARLKERFILTGGVRDLPARQQTMTATIAWSYNLLSEAERAMLRRVAIFAGGSNLEAAEAVCGDDSIPREYIAGLLSSLVEKSLLHTVRTATTTRYVLLESVRAFALDQLSLASERTTLARRHAHWLADLADRADADYLRKPMNAVLEELWPDLDNVRAALDWALHSPANRDQELAGRIAGGLRGLWILPGRFVECREWAESALARIDSTQHPHVVARLLRALIQSSDGESMFAAAARAVDLFEAIDDRRGLASLHNYLAFKFCRRRRPLDAQGAIDRAQSLMLEQQLETSLPFAYFLNVRALVHAAFERFDQARADLAESARLASSFGDQYFVIMRCSLFAAEVEFTAGNIDRAYVIVLRIIESPTASAADGDVAFEARLALASILLARDDLIGAAAQAREMLGRGDASRPTALEVVAAIAARADAVTAGRIAGFVDAWCAHHDHCRTPFERCTYEILNATLQEQHSSEIIAASREAGSLLSWERALDLALRVDEPSEKSSLHGTPPPKHHLLSDDPTTR